MWKQRGKAVGARNVVLFSIDLNLPPLVEDPERFDRSGVLFCNGCFIFCHMTENEAKENARFPRILRVADAQRGTMGKKKT